MKKSLCILLVLVLLCTPILLVACNNDVDDDSPAAVVMHKVTIKVETVRYEFEVAHGEVIGDFTERANANFVYVLGYDYFLDLNHSNAWDLYRDVVLCDITLYGKMKDFT